MKNAILFFTQCIIAGMINLSLWADDGNPLDKELYFDIQEGRQVDFLSRIVPQINTPILYEGYPQKGGDIKKVKNGICKDVLTYLLGPDCKFSLEKGAIVIQDTQVVDASEYPLDKYKFSCSFVASDASEWIKERKAFLLSLQKNRILLYDFAPNSNAFDCAQQRYADANLREILIDMLQHSQNICLIYKMLPEDNKKIYAMFKDKPQYYSPVIDDGEPLYGLTYVDCAPFAISAKPAENLNDLSKEKNVLQGTDLAKVDISWKYDKTFIFDVLVRNMSSQALFFKDVKSENFFLHTIAFDSSMNDARQTKRFLIYLPQDSETPNDFVLKPGEQFDIKIPLFHARARTIEGSLIWGLGAENDNTIKIGTLQTIEKLPCRCGLFGAMIYFYDKNGRKYKSYIEENVDIDQGNPKNGIKNSIITIHDP